MCCSSAEPSLSSAPPSVHSLYPPSDSPHLEGDAFRPSDLLSSHSHSLLNGAFSPSSASGGLHPLRSVKGEEHADSASLDSSDEERGGEGLLHSASAILLPPQSAPVVVPSPHFSSVLSSHISLLAEESVRAQGETAFGRLYAQAKGKANSRKIQQILTRRDIKKERKVELIAHILTELNP